MTTAVRRRLDYPVAQIEGLLARFVPKVRQAVRTALRQCQEAIHAEALRSALERKDVDAAMDAVPLERFTASLLPALERTFLLTMAAAGRETSLPVRKDGSLGEAASFMQHAGSSVDKRRQEGPHAHCIVPDPVNRFALVCDLGLDQVLIYDLDAANAGLKPGQAKFTAIKAGSGPRHLAFHPGGRFAYLINEMGCTVIVSVPLCFAVKAHHRR